MNDNVRAQKIMQIYLDVAQEVYMPNSFLTLYSVVLRTACLKLSFELNKQWRNKVRSQQYEREKELSDHAVVIKELQKVIGNERIAKEQLDNQVCFSLVVACYMNVPLMLN